MSLKNLQQKYTALWNCDLKITNLRPKFDHERSKNAVEGGKSLKFALIIANSDLTEAKS